MDASSQTQTRLAALPAQLRRWGSAAAALACVLNGVWLACFTGRLGVIRSGRRV